MTVMGEVLPYRTRSGKEETTAYLGMVIFLASWAMLFGSLFFAYAYLRARTPMWTPAAAAQMPLWLPWTNTAVIVASSGTMQLALSGARRAKLDRLTVLFWATVALGALFIVLQVWLGVVVYRIGIQPQTGAYGSVLYGLTALHALHVLVGLVGLGLCGKRAVEKQFTAVKHLPVRLWAIYWHFVGVVWAVMFVSIFLL